MSKFLVIECECGIKSMDETLESGVIIHVTDSIVNAKKYLSEMLSEDIGAFEDMDFEDIENSFSKYVICEVKEMVQPVPEVEVMVKMNSIKF